MYNNYDYGYGNQLISTSSSSVGTWMIIAFVVAIIGGIVGYFLFVSRPKSKEYTGFVAWLHEFLNFKTLFISSILKITYMILAIYITLASFGFIGTSALMFFGMLILGNLILRILYELIMLAITLVNNTTEINNKLHDKNTKSNDKDSK